MPDMGESELSLLEPGKSKQKGRNTIIWEKTAVPSLLYWDIFTGMCSHAFH